MGFDTEENNRGYKMFDEEYLEWENATQKCQALGARLPVLSDAATIKIVKKYLDTADFDDRKYSNNRKTYFCLSETSMLETRELILYWRSDA